MAIAYLALFILGAWSGAIHPMCYAYIGAVLPLVSAGASFPSLSRFSPTPFIGGLTPKARLPLPSRRCLPVMTS